MRVMKVALAAALAVGGLALVGGPVRADSTCSSPAEITALSEQGAAACVRTGTVNGSATVTGDRVVVDGEDANPEPLDGYVSVDGSGPAACASGSYEPGGGSDSLLTGNQAERRRCTPQTP